MNRNISLNRDEATDAGTLSSLLNNQELQADKLVEQYISDAEQVPGQPVPSDHPQFGTMLAQLKQNHDMLRALRYANAKERLILTQSAADPNTGLINAALKKRITDLPIVLTYLQIFNVANAVGNGNVYLYDGDGTDLMYEMAIGATSNGPFTLPPEGIIFQKSLYVSFDATCPAAAYVRVQGWRHETKPG